MILRFKIVSVLFMNLQMHLDLLTPRKHHSNKTGDKLGHHSVFVTHRTSDVRYAKAAFSQISTVHLIMRQNNNFEIPKMLNACVCL